VDYSRPIHGPSAGQKSETTLREKASRIDSRWGGGLFAPEPRTFCEFGHSAGANELKLGPMAGLSGNEPRTVRGSQNSLPENRQEQRFTRFTTKSTPTATKFGTHDHKAVGELSLRGHHSI
jgi:hypothetical protein